MADSGTKLTHITTGQRIFDCFVGFHGQEHLHPFPHIMEGEATSLRQVGNHGVTDERDRRSGVLKSSSEFRSRGRGARVQPNMRRVRFNVYKRVSPTKSGHCSRVGSEPGATRDDAMCRASTWWSSGASCGVRHCDRWPVQGMWNLDL